jgi:hypothetical protein
MLRLAQHREQDLDAIAQFRRTLIDPREPLVVRGEAPVDALEPFEYFRAHLFEPDHAKRECERRAWRVSGTIQLATLKNRRGCVRGGDSASQFLIESRASSPEPEPRAPTG